MSGGAICRCPESQKPLLERKWRVTADRCNYSAFNGYRRESSKYSAVTCLCCPSCWRTAASYPDLLPEYSESEYQSVCSAIAACRGDA